MDSRHGYYYEVLNEVQSEVVFDALDYKKGNKQRWNLIPAGRLAKVWNQYVKYGFVRDEDGINMMVEIIIRNLAKLSVNTTLLGHDVYDGIREVKEMYNLTPYQVRKLRKVFEDTNYVIDDNGQYIISDYGIPKLERIVYNILISNTPEEKLLLIDRVLNVVHARGDLAKLFVEGGSDTLSKLSSIEGLHT